MRLRNGEMFPRHFDVVESLVGVYISCILQPAVGQVMAAGEVGGVDALVSQGQWRCMVSAGSREWIAASVWAVM